MSVKDKMEHDLFFTFLEIKEGMYSVREKSVHCLKKISSHLVYIHYTVSFRN